MVAWSPQSLYQTSNVSEMHWNTRHAYLWIERFLFYFYVLRLRCSTDRYLFAKSVWLPAIKHSKWRKIPWNTKKEKYHHLNTHVKIKESQLGTFCPWSAIEIYYIDFKFCSLKNLKLFWSTQPNSDSVSHLLDTVTTLWLNSGCVVTVDNYIAIGS